MSGSKVTGCELSMNDGGVGGEWGWVRRVAGGAPTAIKRQIRTNKRPIHEGGRVQLEQMGVGGGAGWGRVDGQKERERRRRNGN